MKEQNEKREYIMTPEAREAMRLYTREWRAKHPERAKEIARNYWHRRGKYLREQREKEGAEDADSRK